MSWWRSKQVDAEIAPDEIFLDSANAPSFDRLRFEGRLERPLSEGPFIGLATILGIVFVILLGQAWNLQVRQGAVYAAQSERNSLAQKIIFSNRGVVTDSRGAVLITNEVGDGGVVKRVYETPGYGAILGYVSYPRKDTSGNYYSTDITGLAGIEAYFNTELAGTNGTVLVERDALGKVQSQGIVNPPVHGKDLALTIDMRAQKVFYEAVRELADRVPFLGGAGVLMDVETGEVRALVSYPEYDPNILSNGAPSAVIASYNASARKPYLDRAVAGLYSPGSIVKPLEAAGALTDGVISPDVTINVTGSISVPNPYDPEHPSIFLDWKAHGVVDLRKAIAVSSDIYFYMVGGGYGNVKGLGIERLAYWFRSFGLDTSTGIELPNESSGFVPTPAWKEEALNEVWRLGDTYHTAIGQYAMQVTPVEIARAIAVIANDGSLVKPTLIQGATPVQEKMSVSSDSLQIVREGMRRGVTEGTSVGLSSLSHIVTIAGKTGTAQSGLRNEYHNSWAVGFFPYEHPKYVYVVVMEKGPSVNLLGGVYVIHQFLSNLYTVAPDYFE